MATAATTAKRRYPPAYYRYREKHPSISVRLTKELKELLDSYRGGLSYAKAIRKLLTESADLMKERIKAREEGYNAGRSEYRIWYYCNVCGEEITIYPNSNSHKAVINYLREHGWGHIECHKKHSRSLTL